MHCTGKGRIQEGMAHGEGAAFGVSSKGRIPGYVTDIG